MKIRGLNPLFGALILVAILLAIFLMNQKRWQAMIESPSETSENFVQNLQSAFGDPVPSKEGNLSEENAVQDRFVEQRKNFAMIVDDLSSCLGIPTAYWPADTNVNADSFIQQLQNSLGPATESSDRWLIWHLRGKDGKERRLRLQVTLTADGRAAREMRYFEIDRDGQPEPINLKNDQEHNPSDEEVNRLLNDGEILYRERASYVVFPGGEQLEYVERNGELAEIEFTQGEKFFRCDDISSRDHCQCVK